MIVGGQYCLMIYFSLFDVSSLDSWFHTDTFHDGTKWIWILFFWNMASYIRNTNSNLLSNHVCRSSISKKPRIAANNLHISELFLLTHLITTDLRVLDVW